MAATGEIRFYGVGDPFGELSNFAPYPITLRGKRWPTSEHYFQAQKLTDPREQEEIRGAKTPMIAARMGRDRKRKLRRDWERVKIGVDAQLIEHTENDDFWGDGGDGSGRNELGRILMAVRDALRREAGA